MPSETMKQRAARLGRRREIIRTRSAKRIAAVATATKHDQQRANHIQQALAQRRANLVQRAAASAAASGAKRVPLADEDIVECSDPVALEWVQDYFNAKARSHSQDSGSLYLVARHSGTRANILDT